MSALERRTPSALDFALHYASRGWRVVPTAPGGKVPIVHAWQKQGTTDVQRIMHWWTQQPDNSISIVTGIISCLFVIDIDSAGGKHGFESLADLEAEHGKLPATYTVVTGSGGLHIYFLWPGDGRIIRNSASGVLGPGIDVRGEGGQVVAPPSVHHTGARYELSPTSTHEVAEAPEWLIDLLTAPRATHPSTPLEAPVLPSERPGDIWAASIGWDELLSSDGWALHHTDSSGEQHWTRPGKDRREGTSATVGYKGSDVLKVFTSSVSWLTAEATYSKLGYLASRDFGGDISAAARHLASTQRSHPRVDALPDGHAMDAPWADPTPIVTQFEPPEFPLDSLPAWMTPHVEAVANAIQVQVDAPATLAIGGLSAVATGRINAEISGVWTEPANLYLSIVMRSGAGKSPTSRLTTGWARRWVAQQIEEATPEHDKAAMKARALRKKATADEHGLEVGSVSGDDAWASHLAATEAENAVAPLPYLFLDDTTPEAAVNALKMTNERRAVISTEADLFDMVTSDSKRRPNINVFLRAWDGEPLTRDRKGSSETGPEATELKRPLMSICCAIQPVVLERISRDPELVKRGFVPRFMITSPKDLIGARDHDTKLAASALRTQSSYDQRCTAFADQVARYTRPATIRFSRAAAEMLVAWMNAIEPELGPDGAYSMLAEWWSKCAASVARYAALLWVADGNDVGAPLDQETITRALAMGDYWIGHAHAAYAAASTPEVGQAVAILEAIAESGLAEISVNQIQRACRRPGIGLLNVRDYVPALRLLVDNSWLRPVDGDGWHTKVGTGGKSPILTVWAGMHEMTWKSHLARVARGARIERVNSLSLSIHTHSLRDRAPRATRARNSGELSTGWQPGDDPFAPLSVTPSIDPFSEEFNK